MIADQNALGGFYLNYLDNRLLWLNAMHWITRADEGMADSDSLLKIANAPEPGRPQFWCLEPDSNEGLRFGNGSEVGFYRLFAWLNKVGDARGTSRTLEAPWMIIPDEELLLNAETHRRVAEFLKSENRSLLVLECTKDQGWIDEFARTQGWRASGRTDALRQAKVGADATVYETREGSQIVWMRGVSFTNENFPAPESSGAPASQKSQDALTDLFNALGIELWTEPSPGVDWLDQLDEDD